MDPEQQARRERYLNRLAFQRAQDAALTPPSDAPAAAVRAAWKPIDQFLKEGPDVGERQEPESKQGKWSG